MKDWPGHSEMPPDVLWSQIVEMKILRQVVPWMEMSYSCQVIFRKREGEGEVKALFFPKTFLIVVFVAHLTCNFTPTSEPSMTLEEQYREKGILTFSHRLFKMALKIVPLEVLN